MVEAINSLWNIMQVRYKWKAIFRKRLIRIIFSTNLYVSQLAVNFSPQEINIYRVVRLCIMLLKNLTDVFYEFWIYFIILLVASSPGSYTAIIVVHRLSWGIHEYSYTAHAQKSMCERQEVCNCCWRLNKHNK